MPAADAVNDDDAKAPKPPPTPVVYSGAFYACWLLLGMLAVATYVLPSTWVNVVPPQQALRVVKSRTPVGAPVLPEAHEMDEVRGGNGRRVLRGCPPPAAAGRAARPTLSPPFARADLHGAAQQHRRGGDVHARARGVGRAEPRAGV